LVTVVFVRENSHQTILFHLTALTVERILMNLPLLPDYAGEI